jgi:hypothetical protein
MLLWLAIPLLLFFSQVVFLPSAIDLRCTRLFYRSVPRFLSLSVASFWPLQVIGVITPTAVTPAAKRAEPSRSDVRYDSLGSESGKRRRGSA